MALAEAFVEVASGGRREGWREGRRVRLVWLQGRANRSFDQLRAMYLRRRQRAEFFGQLLAAHLQRLFGRLAPDELHGKTGGGDGRFATEALKARAVDHFATVLLLELHPDAKQIATLGVADGANRVGARDLAPVLRVF